MGLGFLGEGAIRIKAKGEESMKILMRLEFNGAANALEVNKTENGMTYIGIYRVAHPDWSGWELQEGFYGLMQDIVLIGLLISQI